MPGATSTPEAVRFPVRSSSTSCFFCAGPSRVMAVWAGCVVLLCAQDEGAASGVGAADDVVGCSQDRAQGCQSHMPM